MSDTEILNIPEVGATQNNKTITINNAINALEQAANAFLVVGSIGSGPATITETQAVRNQLFRLQGASANFDFEIPSTINLIDTTRVFAVRNETSYVATIKASTGSGAEVELAAGKQGLFYCDNEDILLIALSSDTTAAYDFGFYYNGLPPDNAELMKLVAVRAFDVGTNLANFRGHCAVNPTASADFTVAKNGATVATITVSTGGVFSASGSAFSVAAGDRITITAPTPQDATLANVSIMIAGTRTL